LHSRRIPLLASQLALPGTQVVAWQRPSRQVCPEAQLSTTSREPLAWQVAWWERSGHAVWDGVQTWRAQALEALQ
jgi:hypothetical protein